MNIQGTWAVYFDWYANNQVGVTTIVLDTDGTFTTTQKYTGLWINVAGMIVLRFGGKNITTVYAGNIAGDYATGVVGTFGSGTAPNGYFNMQKLQGTTTVDEVRPEGGLDCAGIAST